MRSAGGATLLRHARRRLYATAQARPVLLSTLGRSNTTTHVHAITCRLHNMSVPCKRCTKHVAWRAPSGPAGRWERSTHTTHALQTNIRGVPALARVWRPLRPSRTNGRPPWPATEAAHESAWRGCASASAPRRRCQWGHARRERALPARADAPSAVTARGVGYCGVPWRHGSRRTLRMVLSTMPALTMPSISRPLSRPPRVPCK